MFWLWLALAFLGGAAIVAGWVFWVFSERFR